MEEDLKALKELVEEIAGKYDIYINTFSFNGAGSNMVYKTKENKNTSIFNEV